MSDVDFLIVGAGPAGLATAIRLRQKLRAANRDDVSVVVIEKAPRFGYHNLSGAVFEADCLDELVPGWREEDKDPFVKNLVPVERDEMYFLTKSGAKKIPHAVIPRHMQHKGDYSISINRMVNWLGGVARREGAEVLLGFAAREVIVEDGRIRGVKLVDLGLDPRGRPQKNYQPGETVRAKVTVICDGSRGVLSLQLSELNKEPVNPQIYSVGIKQLIKLPKDNAFGEKRVMHTLGYPCREDVFGGGFLYDMGNREVAVGLLLGLDWRYRDLNPQREMELLKTHPFIEELLKDGEIVATGVKTVPEGGYNSLPKMVWPGGLLTGDSAGFVNMKKIKGIHYAIYSGMAAADTMVAALEKDDFSEEALMPYLKALETNVLEPMHSARNYRQCFQLGLYLGAPLSMIQHLLPFSIKTKPDYGTTQGKKRLDRPETGLDKATFVSLSGANHREDEPSHVIILDPELCLKCTEEYGNPCTELCPGDVYRLGGEGQLVLSPSNCMHDGSCAVKCPYQNIEWNVPEGGEGPRYKRM